MPDWPEAPSDADLTLTWLHGRGITPIDFTPLRAAVAAVRHESLAAWAQARRLRGAFADAIDAWQTLLKERPDDLALRVALGEALLSAGRIADCRTLLEAAPAAARTAPWCDAFGGLIAFGTGDWQAAEVHLGRLVHERWAPFNAPGLLGWVRLQHADWAGALQWFEHAASCPLLTGHVWEGMGVALQGLARHRDAAAAFGKAIAFAPGETRLHLQRAEALAAAGATEEARSAWWRAIELEPGSTAAHAGLARLSMETVRAESAAQLARIDTGSR
jgi:tetratricopeptide (TPR) repeat protein